MGESPAERPSGQVRAERLLRELARLHEVLHALFRPRPAAEEAASRLEALSSRQAHALFLLQARPATMTELAAMLRLSPTAATPVADRLVELGVAERVRDPTDRRVVYVSTTNRGRELIREGNVWEQTGLRVLAEVLEQEAAGLEEQCAEGLVRMVEAAVDSLARARPEASGPVPRPGPEVPSPPEP
ncbi:MAG: MarR family transcriptional regulator [Candidatus Dormibacteria bacterium]